MASSPPIWNKYKTIFPQIIPHYQRAYYIAQHLIDTQWDTLPNVLLHSPQGFPMSLFLHYVMVQKFGPATRSLHTFEQQNIPFVETPYSFEVDLLHPNIKSLDVVSDFIHTIVSRANVCMDQRHIFLLQNIDALDEERYAFRVLFERFSKNVLFICTTTRISCIETPLRSRFSIWTIPALTTEEIALTMEHLGRSVPSMLQDSRNLLQVLLVSDMDPSTITPELCKLRYPPIADLFRRKWTVEDLRTLSLKICSLNITLSETVQDICTLLSSGYTHAYGSFIQKAADIEHAYVCTQGARKPLFCEWILHTALIAASPN